MGRSSALGFQIADCGFAVSPKTGVSFQVTSVTLSVGNSGGSSDVKASIFDSTDGFLTSTTYYAEYQCSGPGYVPDKRVSWSHQLTDEEAAAYTVQNVFSKRSMEPAFGADWIPVIPVGEEAE